MLPSFRKILRSTKGQSLIEIMLIAPLMMALAFGAIEIGSFISTYLTLSHTSREGANLASRGTSPDNALDAIIAAASPTIRKGPSGNNPQWNVIYTRIVRDLTVPCLPAQPCKYIVDTKLAPDPGQIVRGGLNKTSKLGLPDGSQIPSSVLPGIENVKDLQTFHVIEVFYNYAPNIITYVGRGINTNMYERTIFTNISG
jgi:hypothetical protein